MLLIDKGLSLMCGIVGFFDSLGRSKPELERITTDMASSLSHRGPDDAGVWIDENVGISLGHRRLSILDTSPAGHQPMMSECRRYVLVFNGEIYNHLELRRKLNSGCDAASSTKEWIGHSDTETLLGCFATWGIEETLSKTVGMFALALWDRENLILTIARDRVGEKPLYYGWTKGSTDTRETFIFGSELKALRAYPGFSNEISREALAQYMRFMFVPSPFSIYEGIHKLEPGTYLTLDLRNKKLLDSIESSKRISIYRWWQLKDVVDKGRKNPVKDEKIAAELLENCLSDAVRLQSLADVPVGAFLSGGIDSSTIVALMTQHTSMPVRTFTIGFEDNTFDESPFALAVASHLGTQHTKILVTAKDALEVIPLLPIMYDEPFADSSQIPTHLVSRAARQSVKVALSGDGGDELFGGYNRYFWGPRIWNKLSWMPYEVRKLLGRAIQIIPVTGWDTLGSAFNALRPTEKNISRIGDKAQKLAVRLSRVKGMDDLYLSLVSEWQDPANVVRGSSCFSIDSYQDFKSPIVGLDDVHRMMYRDTLSYLPDDILCKVDRASMSVGLETRAPFLDHRLIEVAWQMPLEMKVRRNTGKWILRQVLCKYVPEKLIDRPKSGFGLPLGEWLRGPLRHWAEDLLSENRLVDEGYFFALPIRQKWVEHLTGRRDHTASLWAVLMFQAWLEQASKK
jgi:asparagine synthase (glutamine-hydrolysing)